MTFEEILTNDDVLDGLWNMHFDVCTPIQELSMPLVLEGRDLMACAQTGTGKTAAYLLPVINMLADGGYPDDAVNCLVMAPTRELAQQIDRQLQGFAYFMPVSGMAIYGGTDGDTFARERRSLKMGADVVIATPGRLISHLNMGGVDLSKVSFFILDEADRMLDMGFFDDIMQIASRLPKERQTLMFSATMPPKIQQLAAKLLRDPAEVKIAVSKPADKIKQSAYVCYEAQKLPLLKSIFKESEPERVIVFSSSKLKVKTLTRQLKGGRFKVAEMHSDLDQEQRDQAMLDFKAGKVQVMVATDILARGIDIDDIEMVVNYDVPHEAEDYVHRIGRTARANRDGRSVTFVSPDEMYKMKRIEKLLEKEVPREAIPADLSEAPSGTSGSGERRGRGGKPKQRNQRRRKPADKKPQANETQQPQAAAKETTQTPASEIGSQPQAEAKPKKRRNHRHSRRKKPAGDTPQSEQTQG